MTPSNGKANKQKSKRATPAEEHAHVEEQIAQWRAFVLTRRAVAPGDAEELEDHLRAQAADLVAAGLTPDEAFLVAVKRMGSQDEISREFARAHSDRLWKQLVLTDDGGPARGARSREALVVIGLAIAAALAVKAPVLFSLTETDAPGFYARNLSLFVFPMLAGYFAWKRGVGRRTMTILVAAFALGAVFANAYSFEPGGPTEYLTALHLPIALWFAVGLAYMGGEWHSHAKRMDFIRFSGEWAIYMALLALGGGVLAAITEGTFGLLEIDATGFVANWLLPCGAMGAAVIAAWLVEAKQGVIESMAPVLTRVFTPLFTLLLLALLGTTVWTRTQVTVERDALIIVNILLVFVVGLLIYAVSARNGSERITLSDRVQFTMIVGALGMNGVVLATMLGRVSEWGFTPNRTAAIGENLILFVNLAWSGWISHVMLRGRSPFAALDRWQTRYIPVYLVWASTVVVVFPLVFGLA